MSGRGRPFTRAWVSGASSGLGRAIAIELARRGAFVHLFARSASGLEETLDLLRSAGRAADVNGAGNRGGDGEIHLGDVTDPERLGESLRLADARHPGGLDLVIAGAGIAESAFPPGTPAQRVNARILKVNLTAAVCTLELALHLMGPRGFGTVSAITSLAGRRTMGAAPAYSASKQGLIGYLSAIRSSARERGVCVTDIRPGFVRTPMTDRNRFRMPFLLEPADAAARSVRGLERRAAVVTYPRRLAWPTEVLARVTPELLWRRLTDA